MTQGMKIFLCLLLFNMVWLCAQAQGSNSPWQPAQAVQYTFIHAGTDTIAGNGGLEMFYKKLAELHADKNATVSIVHIGDSHIQGDGITSVLRNGFRSYFGNAGRGLVFPYQVAASNGPHDVASTSNVKWESNRLVNPSSYQTGISGFGIYSNRPDAVLCMHLKDMDGRQEYFDRMVFFTGSDSANYLLGDSALKGIHTAATYTGKDAPSFTIATDTLLSGFELMRNGQAGTAFGFYGVSLELAGTPGVVYHTIGVNGARYDQYVQSALFWEQLPALHGNLFIISMGTNEAQNPFPDERRLTDMCDSFVQKIHAVAPGAAIVITTPAGSYYRKKKPNAAVEKVAHTLKSFCTANGIACWDMFSIGGGMTAVPAWKKAGLFSHDLVHYNNEGYTLQGQLLLSAFAKGYNAYVLTHPVNAAGEQGKTYNTAPAKQWQPQTYRPAKPKNMEQPLNQAPTVLPATDTVPQQPREYKGKIHVGYMP